MKILDNATYLQALERLSKLRNQKETTESSEELAELESAVEHYESRPDVPARSTGRPTSDPYDLDDC